MTAEISRLPARNQTPLQRARTLNIEAKALGLRVRRNAHARHRGAFRALP